MNTCYVKAYFDWIEQTAALTDAERGRLFIAILEYARSGLEPKLGGREGILFPVFRIAIDRDNQKSKTYALNGSFGGNSKKANCSKSKQNVANCSKNYNKDKDKDKDLKENSVSDETEQKKRADAFSEFAGDDNELLTALQDFEQMRRSIKKPMTERAKKLLTDKLIGEFPRTQWTLTLEQSISHCWADVYPLKENEQSAASSKDILRMIEEGEFDD